MMGLRKIHTRTPEVGHALALFVARTDENVKALVSELERYCEEAGPRLRWWIDDDDERWRRVTPELLAYPRRRLLETRRRKVRGYCAHVHGGDEGRAPHATFASLSIGEPDLDQVYGILEMWRPDEQAPAVLLAHAIASAKRLQPVQGYAGLAVAPFVDPIVSQDSNELQFALAQQCDGLEIQSQWFTINAKLDSLCSVQWLTIVGDSLLAPIGGRAALANLPAEVLVHDYGSGVVIQAGATPDAGDANKPDTLGLYRAVARTLAPIRIREPESLNVEDPRSLGVDETRKWFRRLERSR